MRVDGEIEYESCSACRNSVAVMSRAMLSQNTKLIIGNAVIKAVTKILCAELLQTVEKKNDLGQELDAKERGNAYNI